MEWNNRFTLGGFTVTYCTFEMAWEVIEKRDGYEVAFRWFGSSKKAEAFFLRTFKEDYGSNPYNDMTHLYYSPGFL